METVKVDLKTRSYEIHIGPGLLAKAGAYISPFLRRLRVAVVTDSTVADLHLEALREGLLTANIEMVALTLPAGEQTKKLEGFGPDRRMAAGSKDRTQ
jgi:3-dehydroquinate synthase